MMVDTTLLRSCVELIVDLAWWYFEVVGFYADMFWLAGGGDLFVGTIEAVCLAYNVPLLGGDLSRRIAAVYSSPHDQYRLVVSLGASGLWYRNHGPRLLEALRALTASGDAA
jgi:hypothetical protein